jgi:RND family efflux transporter MFP subunit
MTMRTSWLLGGLALVSLILPACSSGPKAARPPLVEPVPVTTATIGVTDLTETFEVGGVVQARTTATLMARILAPVQELHAVPGNRVRAGQVLIVMDGRDLAAQARRARAEVAAAAQHVIAATADGQAAESALALARANHARVATLHPKRSATLQELDDATAALRMAEARATGATARAHAVVSAVEGARAASEAADATHTFARIVAPFDGVVTETLIEVGNMAAPGTPLMRVEDARGFRLDVQVDQSRIGQITPGAAVAVSFDMGLDGVPRVTSGTVAEIARTVDAGARAFLVKIALPAEVGLRSGLFGRARFAAGPRRAMTVPAGALVRRGQVTSVFVVENGIARLRLVNVSGTEVLAGLSDGEVVIVNPPPSLTDSRRVDVGGRR